MSSKRSYRKAFLPVVVILIALIILTALAVPALAISNGQPDVDGEYSNVGLLIEWFNGRWHAFGSVTLISEHTGLVSGVSTAMFHGWQVPAEDVYVTFSADISTLFDGQPGEDVALIPVSGYKPHPLRLADANRPNPYNVGLVFFAEPVTDIEPVLLPDEYLLDELWAAGAMQPGGAADHFTVVGYGVGQDLPSTDPYFTQHRSYTGAQALAVKHKELLLQQNQAAGNGGACDLVRGDWASPALWTNDEGQRVVTALFSWAENCNSRGAYYRVDIPEALNFIRDNMGPKCVAPPEGLVSWWPGDGNANDIADGNDGLLEGDATYDGGMVGQAFSFDGDGDYVRVPRAANLDVGAQLTIHLWMKADPSNPMDSCCQGLVSTDHYEFAIANGAGGSVYGVLLMVGGDNGHAISSDLGDGGYPLNPGEWYHVAGVYDGAHVKLYVNGELVVEPPELTGTIWPMLETSFLAIGSEDGRTNEPDLIGERYFHGLIDEVGLYNRGLSAEEIQAIYAAGSEGLCKS